MAKLQYIHMFANYKTLLYFEHCSKSTHLGVLMQT